MRSNVVQMPSQSQMCWDQNLTVNIPSNNNTPNEHDFNVGNNSINTEIPFSHTTQHRTFTKYSKKQHECVKKPLETNEL